MTGPSLPRTTSGLRHIVAQAGWAGIFQVVGLVLRYLLVLLIARAGGAEGLGLYTLAVGFGTLAALLARVGLDRAAMRFTAYYRALDDAPGIAGLARFTTRTTMTLSVVVGAGLFFGAGALADAWNQPKLLTVLRVVALAVPAIAVGEVWRDLLRGFQDIRLASALEMLAVPGGTILLLAVATAAGYETASAAVAATAAAFWLAAAVAGIRVHGVVSQMRAKPVMRSSTWLAFGGMLWLEGVMLYLLQWADQLLIGLFLTAADVGQYAAAARVAALTAIPLLAVNMILGPTVANLFGARNFTKLRETYSRLTWATGAAGLAIGMACITFGPWILVFFSEDFVGGYPILVILTLGHIVNAGTGSAGVVLGMTGHVRLRVINAALLGVLNVILNLLLIPRLGSVGAAIATSATLILINLLQIAEVRYVHGFWGYDVAQLRFWIVKLRYALTVGGNR